MIDFDRAVERLATLVKIPSENPPGDESEVAARTAAYCDELGLDVEMHEPEPGRASVVARWRGGDGPILCYCSHIDVVPAGDPTLWTNDPFGGVVSEGRLFGRGAGDAKGPVAAALEAVAALRDAGWSPAGTLELALVADEEAMGFKGAARLVSDGVLRPDIAIVGEPTTLRVVRAQRGACWATITTRGVAAHGSAPERGVNAILHMAEIAAGLPETVPDSVHPLLGGASLNVGTIRGGVKVNVVPATCVVEVDRRTIPGETRESVVASIEVAIDKARLRYPDLDAQIDVAFFAESFEVAEDAPVIGHVRAASESAGVVPTVMGFRGASDARFFAAAGCDVVVWGPGDITLAHTANEYIELEELKRGATAYAHAFARILA